MNKNKDVLTYFEDFIDSPLFRYVIGGVIALVGILLFLASFAAPWLDVPEATIEHDAHYRVETLSRITSRAGFREGGGDIIIAFGDHIITGESDVSARLTAAVNRARLNGQTTLPVTVYRAGSTRTLSLPLPRYPHVFELTIPQAPMEPADVSLDIVLVEAQPLVDAEGVTLSAMDIWLGNNEAIPTLDLQAFTDGKSGFSAVRTVDRALILIPLGGLVLVLIGGMYLSSRLDAKRALLSTTVVALILSLFPFIWQVFSTGQWRGYLIDNFERERSVEAIDEGLRLAYNINQQPIFFEVVGARGQTASNIVEATQDQLTNAYHNGAYRQLALVALITGAICYLLVTLKAEGIIHNRDQLAALIMLSPSLILLGIFVYGFIAQTISTSLTNWGENRARPALQENVTQTYVGLQNYQNLMTDITEFSFRSSLVNTFFFTLFFLVACILLGFLLAVLVDQRIRGEGIFRTIFLFPMSISFVVTGTIWGWLLQQKGGVNILPQKLFGLKPLTYRWTSSDRIIWGFQWMDVPRYLTMLGVGLLLYSLVSFGYQRWRRGIQYTRNWGIFWAVCGVFILIYVFGLWDAIWLPLDSPEIDKINGGYGYNTALSGILIAAVWQMSGYVMALYLAGIRGISDDLREAARVDGCSELQIYRYIVIPLLRPITLSAIIILGHISLKIFDLVFAMTGPDNNSTIVPGILLYTQAFRGNRFASGAAVAVVMLFLVSLVIVPYLWTTQRSEQKA